MKKTAEECKRNCTELLTKRDIDMDQALPGRIVDTNWMSN